MAGVWKGDAMQATLVLVVMLIAIRAVADPPADEPAAKITEVCLADVTVTARPTGQRHQSYVFTLESKSDEDEWTFELYESYGGAFLLYAVGSRTSVDEERQLDSPHQGSTVVKLQQIDPRKATTGETLTHRLVSVTWSHQEPNQASEATSEPAPAAAPAQR